MTCKIIQASFWRTFGHTILLRRLCCTYDFLASALRLIRSPRVTGCVSSIRTAWWGSRSDDTTHVWAYEMKSIPDHDRVMRFSVGDWMSFWRYSPALLHIPPPIWYEDSENMEHIYCMCVIVTVLQPRAGYVHEKVIWNTSRQSKSYRCKKKKKRKKWTGAIWYEESKNIEHICCMCVVDTVLEPRAECVHEENQKYKRTKQKLRVYKEKKGAFLDGSVISNSKYTNVTRYHSRKYSQ